MKILVWIFCLLALSFLIHAQDTCATSDQLTRMQMQMQIDRDNLNARIDMQANQTALAFAKQKLDFQAYTDLKIANQNQYIAQQNLAMIDAITIRLITAFFATAGWFFSLTMLNFYWHL